jgi:hypothetical protein
VSSVLKLERHGGHRGPRFGCGWPRCNTLRGGWRIHAALWHVCDHGTPHCRSQGASAFQPPCQEVAYITKRCLRHPRPRNRSEERPGRQRSLKNPVPEGATTGVQDFWTSGSQQMNLSEEKLCSVGRKWVYIFNRWKAKKLIPV